MVAIIRQLLIYGVVAGLLYYVAIHTAPVGAMVFYIFVIWSIYRVAAFLFERWWLPFAAAVLAVAWPFFEHNIKMEGFRYALASTFASKLGGESHGRAENVRGFLMDIAAEGGCGVNCVRYLTKDGYEFIEVVARQPLPELLVDAPGLHRFSLKPRGHASCALFEKHKRRQGIFVENFPGVCIGAEKVATRASRYTYANKTTQHDFWFGKVFRFVSQITAEPGAGVLYFYSSYGVQPYQFWLLKYLGFIVQYEHTESLLNVRDVLIPPPRANPPGGPPPAPTPG